VGGAEIEKEHFEGKQQHRKLLIRSSNNDGMPGAGTAIELKDSGNRRGAVGETKKGLRGTSHRGGGTV